MHFRIEPHLVEDRQVTQRTIEAPLENRREVNGLFGGIIEPDAKCMRTDDLKRDNAINGMVHGDCSFKGYDRLGAFAALQTFPIRRQFSLMKFRPGFDQSPLPPRQSSREQFNRIKTEDSHIVLVVGMKVRRVVRDADFHIHSDDDPEESAQFWHDCIISTEKPDWQREIGAQSWTKLKLPPSSKRSRYCWNCKGRTHSCANAYAKAGRTLAQLETKLEDVVKAGTLEQIPGIGATLRDKITLLVTTGHLPFYEDLKAKTPPGLVQMLRLPGVGPKKIKLVYDQLGIDDLAKLKEACANGTIAKLKGFGEKTQQNILEGLAFLDQMGNRVRLDQALLIADGIVAELRKVPGIQRLSCAAACAAAARRSRISTSSCSAKDAAPIMDAFVKLPNVQKVVGHGETKSSVTFAGIDHHTERVLINADLRVVSDAQFPFALNYFTGSKEHNIRLRAARHRLRLQAQ